MDIKSTPSTPGTDSSPSRIEWRRLALGSGFIFVLVFAVYWPALRGQFVWDDLLVVNRNPLVKGTLGLGSIWFREDFPLATIGFWLQWLAWGKNPLGYHVVNVLLHGTGAVLLWRLLVRLRIPGAWIAAVIFAVHPVCVASVAWISELKNTLSLPFYLLSISSYLVFEDHQSQGKQAARWYWFALGAFLLALLSKTSTVMLPVVLLGCAWWRRGRVTRADCLRTIPFFGLALAFGVLTVWFQVHQTIGTAMVQDENLWGRLAAAGMALWFYLGKALLPINLCAIYPRWPIDPALLWVYVPGLIWCGVLILCWRFRSGWGRPALFALICFTANLFPALGFFDMYFLALARVSDHFQYLSLIAVIALAAGALRHLLPVRAFGIVTAVLVLALSAMTVQRARVFASDERLWQDTLAKNPAAWTAHNNLGCIRAEQNNFEAAITHFAASLKFNPNNAQAHCNLARALSLRNRPAEAEEHFQAALKLKPDDAEIHRSYGSSLAAQGKGEEALRQLRDAVRLSPDVESLLPLATLLRQSGQLREAVEHYRRILVLKPDTLEAINNLAGILAMSSEGALRNGKEAVELAERGCRLSGNTNAMLVGTLALAYAEAGRFSEAIATAQKAGELAAASGNTRFAEIQRQLLSFYRAGKPYHEPAR